MNFTALSLTLLWNSPIYCICSSTSSSCRSKCSELGYYYIPNDRSFFKSLRDNIHHEITFVIISDIDSNQSLSISFPYFIFIDRSITLSSYNKSPLNLNLEIDTSAIIFDKSYFQKKIPIQKGSLKLNYINLIFSLSSDNYGLNSIEFDFLSFKNSSLLIKNNKTINLKSKKLLIDDKSLKYIALRNLNYMDDNCSLNQYENNYTEKIIYYNILPFSFDELNIYLTHPSNTITFNNSWLSFSESNFINEDEDFQLILYAFNASCDKIQLVQEDSFEKSNRFANKEFNISVFISDMSTPISCDFSNVKSAFINALVKCENQTNIISTFDIDVGSNTINIIPDFPDDENNSFQFTTSDSFIQSSLFTSTLSMNNPIDFEENTNSFQSLFPSESSDPTQHLHNIQHTETFIHIDNQDTTEFYDSTENSETFDTDDYQSNSEPDFTQSPTKTPVESPIPIWPIKHIYQPFFYVDGNCDIFIDSVSLPDYINSSKSLKDFIIDSESIHNLSLIFKLIIESPYKTISLTIDLNSQFPIIIPPSVFYRKSFHIKSRTENQYVFFDYHNFTSETYQNFTNIIISTRSSQKLDFPNLCLYNSFISCSFTCSDLIIDIKSLRLQQTINISDNIDQDYKNIFIKIPKDSNIDVFPINRMISIKDEKFKFLSDTIENIFIITNSNSSVHFETVDNETDIDIDSRTNFTFIVYYNNNYKDPIITFYNAENITEELSHFAIDARKTTVNVISDGFKFTIKDTIRLVGDPSVNFNNLNRLFFNSYCICNDTDENFDCLGVCEPEMGPILPFDKDIISNTVQLVPIDYINFTIFGSNIEKNPYFIYRLFNRTSLDIKSGQLNKDQEENNEEVAYLTLETTDKLSTPNSKITYKLSNLNIIIAPQQTSELYLNFATAFFSSLTFIIPSISTLTISSEAVDTDVLTLLKFPSNLIFTSPTQMCNISCSTIISTIVIRSNQQIDLGSEEYNISYRLDLSLLLHMPANITCLYGTSKSEPLKILLLEDQPKSLADIPDLRFDVSRVDGSSSYIEFPDQWNSNIEDVSSKIEIFHNDKILNIQGKVVDDVYTTKPPTIFHNGAGYLYINDILSTFTIKYCICDSNFTDCSTICKSIGPVISFDQEEITATIKSNPTRHITYVIFGSLPDWRPYFRLSDFSVKSFTLSSESSIQFIDLETAYSTPVVPLSHRFISLSIRPIPINETADMKFHTLHIENSRMDCKLMPNGGNDQNDNNYYLMTSNNFSTYDVDNCSLSQIDLITDLESAYALSRANLLSPAKSLSIIGRRTVSKVVMESKNEIDLSSRENEDMMVKFNLSELSPSGSSVLISTLLGYQNTTKTVLSVELPQHETTYDQIPKIKFDLTQVDGSQCFMMFPTSMWVGELSNLSKKIVVEYGRHDFFQESSKHEDKYDGIPPIVSVIGSGGYYINGRLFGEELRSPTSKPIKKPFKSLGPSAIAGIVIGSVAFVVIVVGAVVIIIQKRKKKTWKDSIDEITPEIIRQVNLGLVEEVSDEISN